MKMFLNYFFPLLIAALMATANAADPVLGAGDVIRITIYDHPDLSLEARVSETGTISYPFLGEVMVLGLVPSAAGKKLAVLLEQASLIRNAQVSIIVTQMQSQQVSVLGQVSRPGRYPVDGVRSITDILALAGGVNADAGDEVTLIHSSNTEPKREVINLTDLIGSESQQGNVQVLAGDVLYVERVPKFYIYGEVQRPGTYRLEKNMTILQALSVGGGLTPRGTERGMKIKRRGKDGRVEVLQAAPDELLKVDDVLLVRESLF